MKHGTENSLKIEFTSYFYNKKIQYIHENVVFNDEKS